MEFCNLRSGVAVLGAAAMLWTATAARAADPLAAGMIKRVSGSATVERAGTALPAAAGMELRRGDRVVTGRPGGVGIVLADDSVVTAGPDSQVVVADLQFDATTHDGSILVRLLRGTLHFVTGLIGKQSPQNIKVETPTAVMGVRGTEFIVQTAGAGE